MTSASPKIALVYDWVTTTYGGAEVVLAALHQLYPEAPLLTTVRHPRATWAQGWQVRPSWLQHLPGRWSHRWLLPLMPLAVESLDLDEYDIIISVSSSLVKGVLTKPWQLHVSYLLTPPRYLYSHPDDYQLPDFLPGVNWLQQLLFKYLRWWDQAAAWRPDVVVPISKLVQQRFTEIYSRPTAEPLYPPVELPAAFLVEPSPQLQAALAGLPDHFMLSIGRLVSYKRVDATIAASQKLHQPLVVVGDGPERSELEAMVDPHWTRLVGAVSETDKAWLLSQASAVIMPGLEDFGITALEPIVRGKPVLVHQQSGVAELLTEQEAVKIASSSIEAVTEGIKKLQNTAWRPQLLQQKAQKYATTEFCRRFDRLIKSSWQKMHE